MSSLRLLLPALLFASAPVAPAATIFLDFGDSAQPTTGNYNNLTKGGISLLSISNLVDSAGSATGISVSVSGFHAGNNANGTTAPAGAAAIFESQATRDNFFGSTALFGGVTAPTGTVLLGGLDASGNTAYTFDFFGSRTGVADNRETEYRVAGLTASSVFLDTSNNTSNIVTVSSMIPDSLGNITITVDPGPNNTNSSGFFYLGATRITSVPEPGVTLTTGLVGLLAALRRRRA